MRENKEIKVASWATFLRRHSALYTYPSPFMCNATSLVLGQPCLICKIHAGCNLVSLFMEPSPVHGTKPSQLDENHK
jgi:hypothetical protein